MSKEYIERDAVLNDIAELFTLCHETLPNECGHHFVVEADLETHWDFVKNLSAADVRPVVYCADCAVPHNEWTGCPKLNGTLVCPEDFCSHGVNKEEEA